jgi:hypothetical protein
MMLRRGDIVPHFVVRTVTGDAFDYSAIWQRKNLVLIIIPPDSARHCEQPLRGRDAELESLESVCVMTHDGVAGLPAPAALVADRWGEIIHLVTPADSASLPAAQELLDWLGYIQNRCPECEGEAR